VFVNHTVIPALRESIFASFEMAVHPQIKSLSLRKVPVPKGDWGDEAIGSISALDFGRVARTFGPVEKSSA
jgi:hypothetical protein